MIDPTYILVGIAVALMIASFAGLLRFARKPASGPVDDPRSRSGRIQELACQLLVLAVAVSAGAAILAIWG
jgi:hypothetical protein